jgi:hypothetical protein
MHPYEGGEMIIELTNEERAILRVALGYALATDCIPSTNDELLTRVKALRERLARDGE